MSSSPKTDTDVSGSSEITNYLLAWRAGDQEALSKVMDLVYRELHRIAEIRFANEPSGHTLQPTALIHELYIRMLGEQRVDWKNRAQFLGIAARMMHRILIDHARKRRAVRRGGGVPDLTLDRIPFSWTSEPFGVNELLALEDALTKLKKIDMLQARIVEIRFFGGLSANETAGALGITPRHVKRKWSVARLWLYRELTGGE